MELIRDDISDKIIESAKRLSKQKIIGKITVRDILRDMGLTNRVFYNRFHNIEEVLDILYLETVKKVRESLDIQWDGTGDFFEHIMTVALKTLQLTYESRQNMGQYIFEADSLTNTNYDWWNNKIKKLIVIGKENGFLKVDLDETAVSYSIWCFIRGFNTDALVRNIPKDEAVSLFRYGFGCMLDGIKA